MGRENLILIGVLFLAALIAWLALAIRRAWKAWLLRRRMRGAASGEELAEWGVDRLYLFDATRQRLHAVEFGTDNASPP